MEGKRLTAVLAVVLALSAIVAGTAAAAGAFSSDQTETDQHPPRAPTGH